jgi:D-lactate dehydrogenase (cytochrome)
VFDSRVRTRAPRDPLRPPAVESSADAVAAHLEDAAHMTGGHALGITFPEDEGQVAASMDLGVPLLPVGAQSSVTGGATPFGELLVSTSRLRGIGDVRDGAVRVQAGVALVDLEAALNARGHTYPPAPTWTAATVGGIVATNAAGPATFKYGVTRDWVRGLTVVLPCGEVLEIEREQVRADGGRLEIVTAGGPLSIDVPALAWPDVPKRSAGYACTAGMDLVDLFVGAEGTLGIVVDATLRVIPVASARARAMVPCRDEAAALRFVDRLRRESHRTWRTGDPMGIDVAAVEHLDLRSIEIVREDGVDRREHLVLGPDVRLLLFVDLDLPAGTTRESAWAEVERALDAGAADGPLVRFCRLADQFGLLDEIELAMPGDQARLQQMTTVREAVPDGVNARVARLRATLGPAVHKTAADMVVPWPRFGEMLEVCRGLFAERDLDHAIWGHVSDGNVHPNVLPRRVEDVEHGKAAILALGRAVIAMGGCPLAEHGVGRHPVKKQLLRLLHGDAGIDAMRAVKRMLDPAGIMAPGVLF